jgi:hypothetical protein
MLGLAGCSTTHFGAQDNPGDPLLGESPTAPRSTSPAPGSTASLPPAPTGAGTTNAALASQTPPGLAITAGDGWARKVEGTSPPAAGSYKPVSQPREPKVEAIPKDTSIASPSSSLQPPAVGPAPIQPTGWTAGSPSPTYTADQLEAMLKQAGVLGHRQESLPDGRVKLTCVAQTSPTTTDNLEITAADYSTAVLAILREIDARRPRP